MYFNFNQFKFSALIAFIFLLVFQSSLLAQTCGTDELHQYMMNTDPEYRAQYERKNESIYRIISNQSAGKIQAGVVYTIPVVVHVIHLGEAVGTGSNISVSQINEAIRGLNERYRNIIGNSLDIELEFCLASQDPNGNATTGIVRVDGRVVPNYTVGIARPNNSSCLGADDQAIKDLSKWPVTSYYNFWVVHDICGNVSGYAYYPWGGSYDGAVIDRNYMTYNAKTLAHEVGHAFNLPHTFNGDGGNVSCPLNDNCATQGDFICDTPPHKQNDCGTTNPCSVSGDWSNTRYNYMSYCSITNDNGLFTSDQKNRIRAELSEYPRGNLLNSIGCNAPGVYDLVFEKIADSNSITCDSLFSPVLTVRNFSNTKVTSFKVDGKLNNTNIPTYTWTGNLDINATVTFAMSKLKAMKGNNYLTLYISSPNGKTDIDTTDNQKKDTVYYSQPVVNLGTFSKTCTTGPEIILTGGTPVGGTYSGKGVTSGKFYPSVAGKGTHVIYYTYKDAYNCSAKDSSNIQVDNCTDIVELKEIGFFCKIYPNPNNGKVMMQINFPGREEIQLEIMNIQGQSIHKEIFTVEGAFIKTFDLTDQPNGSYLFNFLVNGKNATVALILSR